jgi:hypothetical protein
MVIAATSVVERVSSHTTIAAATLWIHTPMFATIWPMKKGPKVRSRSSSGTRRAASGGEVSGTVGLLKDREVGGQAQQQLLERDDVRARPVRRDLLEHGRARRGELIE